MRLQEFEMLEQVAGEASAQEIQSQSSNFSKSKEKIGFYQSIKTKSDLQKTIVNDKIKGLLDEMKDLEEEFKELKL